MNLPVLHLAHDENGTPVHRIEYEGLCAQHQQLWQAEMLLDYQARAQGITLPDEWLRRPLGGRTMLASSGEEAA
jgi:hypothetical protein